MGKVFGGRKVSCPETTWVWRNSALHGPVGKWPDPTHRWSNDPVWVKCCCPVCAHNRRLKRKSGTYLLDRGLKRKLAPFNSRLRVPKVPDRKQSIDYLKEAMEEAGY